MADMLATPGDLASLLERDDLDLAKTTMLIEIATAIVQGAVGQRIVEVVDEDIEIWPDTHSRYLKLPVHPLTSVSAVTVGVTAITDFTRVGSRLWRRTGWRSTYGTSSGEPTAVTVTCTHGYPAGHQKLQRGRGAVVSLIVGVYDNPNGVAREAIDDYSVAYEAMATRMEESPYLRASLRAVYSRPDGSKILTAG